MAFSAQSSRILRRVRFQFKSFLSEMVTINIPNSWIKLSILGVIILILIKLALDSRDKVESLWPKTIVKGTVYEVLKMKFIKDTLDAFYHPFCIYIAIFL